MRYDYFQPASDLRDYFGSYYIMDMPDGGGSPVRVEMPFIRFLLQGESVLQHDKESVLYPSPSVLICGPSTRSGKAQVSPGTIIFGASILPRGWQALFGTSMRKMANKKMEINDFHDIDSVSITGKILKSLGNNKTESGDAGADGNDKEMVEIVDNFLRSLINVEPVINEAFLQLASQWLLTPTSPGIDELLSKFNLSHRQLDRLCNDYFGASPKRLHRIFRVLHVSNHLALTGEQDWKKAAGEQFYDQAHLIKDFKQLIGCTPGEFIGERSMMIRFDLMKRQSIEHQSLFSLIG